MSTSAGAPAAARLAWATLATPVGEVSAGCTAAGIARVRFGPPPEPGARLAAARPRDLAEQAGRELREYFAGRRRIFGVPVDLAGCSQVQQRVLLDLAAGTGFGQTITYGALAARAGLAAAAEAPPARVVGQIMGANPCPLIVPCHRVVAGDGLGGYSGGTGIEVKRWLLIFEGALPATLDWDPAGPAAAWHPR